MKEFVEKMTKIVEEDCKELAPNDQDDRLNNLRAAYLISERMSMVHREVAKAFSMIFSVLGDKITEEDLVDMRKHLWDAFMSTWNVEKILMKYDELMNEKMKELEEKKGDLEKEAALAMLKNIPSGSSKAVM